MQRKIVGVDDLDLLKMDIVNLVEDAGWGKNVSYIDVRVGVSEGVGCYVEDDSPRQASKDWSLSLGVRVIGGGDFEGAGFCGKGLGVNDFNNFQKVLIETIQTARQRAFLNSKYKKAFKDSYKLFGKTVQHVKLAPIEIHKTVVPPRFEIDPRKVTPKEITEYAIKSALSAKKHHPFVKRVEIEMNSSIKRQLFVSSEGSVIDQWYAQSGGTVFIVSANDKGDRPVDLYHHTGGQLGFEALIKGKNPHGVMFEKFAENIADETVQLCNAKPAPATDRAVTVVLDPDLVALFAHEIIGHPSELDRALKWETGYAGRSWFFSDLENNMVGKQIGSPILNAFSDPTLEGAYGNYQYDDEGTKAKRVYHIKEGVYQDFMNSRATARIIGSEPNGHYKSVDASLVPLIRMSVSAIAPGRTDPMKIIGEVDHGYYAVGHRIPSISESRENFQIAPRLIYEIKNGKIGQVFRNGRITYDSRSFFKSIDCLGNDFKIFSIPNCGKGQPMQSKRVGNGGPTARAMAKIARGN